MRGIQQMAPLLLIVMIAVTIGSAIYEGSINFRLDSGLLGLGVVVLVLMLLPVVLFVIGFAVYCVRSPKPRGEN